MLIVGVRADLRVWVLRIKASPKSKLVKSGVAELDILKDLLTYQMAPQRAKYLSNLLKVINYVRNSFDKWLFFLE